LITLPKRPTVPAGPPPPLRPPKMLPPGADVLAAVVGAPKTLAPVDTAWLAAGVVVENGDGAAVGGVDIAAPKIDWV